MIGFLDCPGHLGHSIENLKSFELKLFVKGIRFQRINIGQWYMVKRGIIGCRDVR